MLQFNSSLVDAKFGNDEDVYYDRSLSNHALARHLRIDTDSFKCMGAASRISQRIDCMSQFLYCRRHSSSVFTEHCTVIISAIDHAFLQYPFQQ